VAGALAATFGVLPAIAHASSYQAAVVASEPTVYYRLGEAPGEVLARDAGRAGQSLARYRGGALGVPGATADGDTAVDRLRLSATVLDSGEQSIELWARDADNAYDQAYVTRGPGALAAQGTVASGWQLYTYSSGGATRLAIVLAGADVDLPCAAPAGTAWQHYVIAWSALAVTCYVDGESAGSVARPPGRSAVPSFTTVTLDVDSRATLDEFAVYGHELSADEVRAHRDAATDG
jgi:hypothetical protein